LEKPVPSVLIDALKKQKYHIVGKHSAVKKCKWVHEALVNGRACYKEKFYGIKTHRCMQMTPALFYCTQQCLFCWRAQNTDLKVSWNELDEPFWDAPDLIVQESFKAHRETLSGYKGHAKANKIKFTEAMMPKHVAISLAGEPTFYEHIGELISTYHKKGLTTFLVSNGTLPKRLASLREEPTQLYISCCAPNEEIFNVLCRPQVQGAWSRLNETLALLKSFRCPTVIRLTLVKNYNMKHVEEYAKLIEKATPTYIEAKAYMHVGFSTHRLSHLNMPEHSEICSFATALSETTGYQIVDESRESRVVLLSKHGKPKRFETH
jgi:tRNA wybutosine-synthesizing protein 1